MPARVLVVEDEPDIQKMMALFLATLEHVKLVGQAYSGSEAVSLTAQVNPDVILLDLMLPQMNGLEALQMIQQQGQRPHVILVSAYADNSGIRQQARNLGITEFIPKPINLHLLSTRLQPAHK